MIQKYLYKKEWFSFEFVEMYFYKITAIVFDQKTGMSNYEKYSNALELTRATLGNENSDIFSPRRYKTVQ